MEIMIKQRMRKQIRRGTHRYVFACDGIDALDKLKADATIEVVLSDINMPRMDGITLLEHIPDIAPELRTVIVSAYDDMPNIRKAMNRGAFDFITKPIGRDDMLITIDRAVADVRKQRAATKARTELISLKSELKVAAEMQQSILPTALPATLSDQHQCDLNAYMTPARNVGGDFYDFMHLPNGKICVLVADVSDKGISAAMFMMASRITIKSACMAQGSPGAALERANHWLCADNPRMMFVTVVIAVLDTHSGVCTYASAGHHPPVLVRANCETSALQHTGGIALGIMDNVEYQEQTVKFEPGDTLVLYTDGVSEAMNMHREEYGTGRLLSMLQSSPIINATDSTSRVFKSVHKFVASAVASDDITCLSLHRTRSHPSNAHPTQRHTPQQPHQTQKHIMSGHIFRSNHAQQALSHIHTHQASTVKEGLPSVVNFLKEIAQKDQWPAKTAFNANIVVEELLMNTLTHGNQDRDSPIDFEIAVATDTATDRTTSRDGQATRYGEDGQTTRDGDHTVNITISDNGAPFNPIEDAPLADTTSPLEHRQVGGLGLVFVTHMITNPTYRYAHGRNQLTFAILTDTDKTHTEQDTLQSSEP